MSRTAYLFPGQGSQTPGMGSPFHRQWPAVRECFERLSAGCSLDLEYLCFEAPATELRQTAVTQPAVYAVGIAVAMAMRERHGVTPEIVAGHSLGHLTAAAFADLIEPDAGLALVAARGWAMQRAAERDGPGSMVAVLGADFDTVRAACRPVPGASVAAHNAPRQTVISGPEAAVATARESIEARTRARFRPLEVGGAFHSSVMQQATEAVATALESTPMAESRLPIVSDVTADVYTLPDVARRDLRSQVTAPVDWVGVIETLRARGVDTVVELPPAGTLSRFANRIDGDMAVFTLDGPETADAAIRSMEPHP